MVKKKDTIPKSSSKPPPKFSKSSHPSSSSNQQLSSRQKHPDGTQDGQVDTKTQQLVLDGFSRAFNPVLTSASAPFPTLLQEVKAALYDRDFARAFGRAELLDVYAARWSPTRALAYAAVLEGLTSHIEALWMPRRHVETSCDDDEHPGDGEPDGRAKEGDQVRGDVTGRQLRVLCIGGGAAETVALAAFLRSQHDASGALRLVDSAPWEGVVSKLHHSLTTPPPLSKYASEAAKAANAPFLAPSLLSSQFVQQDILNCNRDELAAYMGTGEASTGRWEEEEKPCLITLLFTLNELYTTSGIARTTAFLMSLSETAPNGSLLLVVDSPGSYSETSVGKEAKRYPMQWLLDHTLKRASGEDDEESEQDTDQRTDGDRVERKGRCKWAKVESNDSVWFRLGRGLQYPIPLEDMRYQLHLYRATREPPG